jgi:hypothetical protein
VIALPDESFFEDFSTELKYLVEDGKKINELSAHDLNSSPLKFGINITKRGSLLMCLLILNDSEKPEKVLVKYEGISQEFTIDWDKWGWAPLTLLNEYPSDKKVDFEILPVEKNSHLKIAKVYFKYQDVRKTD